MIGRVRGRARVSSRAESTSRVSALNSKTWTSHNAPLLRRPRPPGRRPTCPLTARLASGSAACERGSPGRPKPRTGRELRPATGPQAPQTDPRVRRRPRRRPSSLRQGGRLPPHSRAGESSPRRSLIRFPSWAPFACHGRGSRRKRQPTVPWRLCPPSSLRR